MPRANTVHRMLAAAACLTALLGGAREAAAQGFLDKVKDTAEQAAEDEVLSEVEEKARDAVRCVVTDLACIRAARESDQDVVYVDDGGVPLSVGTILVEAGGSVAVFEVATEGDGVATGYTSPVGPGAGGPEGSPTYVSLTGLAGEATGDRVFLRFVVDRESGEQNCDPLETRVQLFSGGNGHLLDPRETTGACPGIAVHTASFDETGMLTVSGEFAAQTDDGVVVTGSFQAGVASFDT